MAILPEARWGINRGFTLFSTLWANQSLFCGGTSIRKPHAFRQGPIIFVPMAVRCGHSQFYSGFHIGGESLELGGGEEGWIAHKVC